jgi:hypothetical protein
VCNRDHPKLPGMKTTTLVVIPILLLAAAAYLGQTAPSQKVDDLERRFQNPPDDSRIMMRWWWFGPAVTKPELEREMRLMKEGGIGGFEVQPVYPMALDDAAAGIRMLPFLSDEFIDALRFTSGKARDLGLRMDLTLGSGWPYGGPSVSIGDAAGRLRVEQVKVESCSRRIVMPRTGAGETLMAAFVARLEGNRPLSESLREITDFKDGAAWLPAGTEGPGAVYFFISSRTGMQVKRPAVGAEGFVLNHLDRVATENYLKNVGDRLMQAFRANRPYAIFCDSLEVYNADWTGDFLQEFQRRRGYDLKPHLPALIADVGSKTLAIRPDWGRTLTELFNDRFLAPLHDWAKRNGTLLRAQAYGSPAVALSSNGNTDLSEGEGHQWKSLSAARWASSANHIYGRSVTSSETWTWLNSPPFRATPLDMKAEADRHFLQGVNQLIGHGWPYTAEGVEYPGWHFYAAAVFNDKNPWWIVMPDVTRYLQRVSFLMRQGEPANDVAIYLPNDDGWAHFTAGNVSLIDGLRDRLGPDVIPSVLGAGYNFDFFDDDALKQAGRIERGALILGPNKYKAVILPNVERINLDTLQELEEFAQTGGVLIATRRLPDVAPGFRATQEDDERIRGLSRLLFEGPAAPAYLVTDETTQLANILTRLVRPDVSFSSANSELGFVHRSTGDAEVYFLANTSNVDRTVKATFRQQGINAEWWDPSTGSVTPATVELQSPAGSAVQVDFEPYGSRILVFTKRTLQSSRNRDSSVVAPPPLDLSTGWQISFGGDTEKALLDNLRSWTDDEKTRYFSGTATYEKTVVVPDSFVRNGLIVRLDFGPGRPIEIEAPRPPAANAMRAALEGPIREAAVVYVHDRRAGSVWHPPYSLAATPLLRSGENKIRIVVANTAINYMAGHALPDYRLLNLRYGERFQVQDLQKIKPVTSGLVGPVRLVASRN